MQFSRHLPRLLAACVLASSLACAWRAEATVIRFTTSLGSYNVRLFPTLMPVTVDNMLDYVNADRYNGTFVHRSVPGFVIQGGGFAYNATTNSAPPIQLYPAINDEPGGGVAGPSNLRGTIAMAKSGPNTVTSQWFINLGNNSSLDSPARPDGGFSAFGRVLGNGMTVVDAIAALTPYDLDGTSSSLFDAVPLRSATGALNDVLVHVTDVSVLNIPAGDFNIDGKVDAADLAVLKADFGSTTKAEADANGNGRVDGADFLIWQRTFGQNFGAPAAAAVAAVPEPAAATLAFLAVIGCSLARRRK
ncbi:peptidylprolyl isomerase [Lacipirellula sp.]|uniref:peptidylprolyl isomerase n=1 Tax=Lacipirellula sp. TaxID=2691419 RepID=UPI003D0F1BF8